MEEKAPNLQLQEPISPESLLPATDFTLLWIGLALLVLLVLIGWLVRKNRKPAATDPIARRRAAYAVARKALDGTVAPNAREAAVQTSLVLRRFLADAVDEPSLFETHEEFISRQNALHQLTPSAREVCAAGFARLVKLKYAPEIPADEPAAVVAEARDLLKTLDGGFQS